MPDEGAAGRTIAERAGLRWPNMLPRTTRSILRLPPGSRLRGAMLRQAARAAFDAWHRGDFELVPLIDDPAVETHLTQGRETPLGFDSVYYGPEGHCRSMKVWNEAWREWNAEIEEVIDQGRDRVLVIARIHAAGFASGIELDQWGAVRYTFREGRIVRVDAAFDRDRDHVLRVLAEDGGGAPDLSESPD
jgi:ketosteroid isomerase-like protein